MAEGFGQDTWCGASMRTGVLARGVMLVALAIFGRLITARGTLRGGDDESAYGFDIAGYIGAVGNAVAINALPGLVRGEIMKDPRLLEAFVTAAIATADDGSIFISIVIVATLQDESSSFTLTLAANDVTAEIVGLDAAA